MRASDRCADAGLRRWDNARMHEPHPLLPLLGRGADPEQVLAQMDSDWARQAFRE